MTLPAVHDLVLDEETDTLTIWFNRPETRNALSARMAEELARVLEALPAQRQYRFVVLRGKGGSFCSGGDLTMFRTVFQDGASRDSIVQANADFGRLLRAVRALPQLFVVAIEGVAMAGGLGLSCIADVVITTADARYALSEVALGIPPAQITPVVIERIGASQARRLLLTAQRFDGTEAWRLGFAHELVADGVALNAALARLLTEARRGAPGAIALTKQIISASATLAPDAMVAFAAERFADAMLGDEAREGMAAFAEKRRPHWQPLQENRNGTV
ncbi:enoyl-CoA hydratase [Kineobactrum sediminis]|uniref:Enoyl-CoA hydratase n=2 Tax=Kineobactrum sediminis TaxID=1905677 RepID=A0A2N5Y4T6_9GAMM|nr:enoyl-CoA hydratase [Kineobactrum sediminis]